MNSSASAAGAPVAVAVSWLVGPWSRPPDRPAQVALALGLALVVLAAVPRGARWFVSALDLPSVVDLRRRRRFLTLASFLAAFLSLGYIAFYLRGGPRAPEAAAYWLQGRALSRGLVAWPIGDPSASFRAEGLVFRLPDRLSGAVPPGFPLLLAAGFLVGAPMLIGPLLAAALVIATWLLTHELCVDPIAGASVPPPPGSFAPPGARARSEGVARLAAALSIASAALRYYTADALPQAAAASGVALALAFALRARRTGELRFFAGAGMALGALVAIEPLAALVVAAAALALAVGSRAPGRSVGWLFALAAPGVLVLLAVDRARTGHAWAVPWTIPTAALHAEAPASVAGGGRASGLLLSLREHLVGAANLEPLALVALAAIFGPPRRRAATAGALVVVGYLALGACLVASGADPSIGAGALVVVVPLEQGLVALGVSRLFPRAFSPAALVVLGLSLVGFAVHASPAHAALAARSPGRPPFEPDVVREANVTHGLLYFDDDRGYELASEPGVAASHGVEAVRMRGDDNDRLVYDALGHPASHRYLLSDAADAGDASASIAPWAPPSPAGDAWRFEGESEWPPIAVTGGTALALAVPGGCASGGRVLEVLPAGAGEAKATLALPFPPGSVPAVRRAWIVHPRIFEEAGGGSGVLVVHAGADPAPLAEWRWTGLPSPSAPAGANDAGSPALPREVGGGRCVDLVPQLVELGADRARAWLELRAVGGPVMLDKTTLRPR